MIVLYFLGLPEATLIVALPRRARAWCTLAAEKDASRCPRDPPWDTAMIGRRDSGAAARWSYCGSWMVSHEE